MKIIGRATIIVLVAAISQTAMASPCYVLFTVDVEATMGGGPDAAIWGILPGEPERHGIERMMDIFDKHGLKATFFVDVYEAPLYGDDAMARVCQKVHDRGHNVGLHTHPGPMFHVPYMQGADLPTQVAILKRGLEMIRQWTGSDAVSHRAGGYMANLDTLIACKEAGIPLDFSYNIGWPASGLSGVGLTSNAPVVRDGVLVVPVTVYIQASGRVEVNEIPRYRGLVA